MRYLPFLLFLFCFTANVKSADTLRIGYNDYPPFVFETTDGRLEGVSVWLWNEIAREDSLEFEMVKLGLDSLIKGLNTKSIDMSLSPLTITSERSKRMDFTVPYYIANATLLVKSKSSWERAVLFLGAFFSVNFFKALFALFLVIFVFGFLTWLFERHHNQSEFEPTWRGLWSGIWWSAVTMTTVGYGDKSPQSLGGRIIALVWMFTAIMIISGFTASITSSLTVSQLAWNSGTINDFKEKPLGTISESATEEWLIKNFFRNVQSYNSIEACFEALRNDEIDAVAYDEPYLQYLLQKDNLDEFELLPINFNLQLYATGLSEKLPPSLKERISNQMLEITESIDWQVVLSEYDLKLE